MKKKILFTFLLLLIIVKIYAQTTKFDETKSSTSLIGSSNSSDLFINNQIVKSIAVANGTSKAELIVNYTVKLQIVHLNTNQQLKVFFNVNSLSGDAEYKSFSLTEMLPSKVSFLLKHIKNGEVLQTYTFTKVPVNGLSKETIIENATVQPFPVEEGIKMKDPIYTLEISDLVFLYDTNDKLKFETKTSNVEKYYSSNTEIKTAITKLDALKIDKASLFTLENPEDVIEYKALASNYINLYNKTKNETFYNNLQINTNDPKELNGNLELMNTKSKELLTNATEVISKFDEVYYLKGMEMLKVSKTQLANSYFNKSISYNANYAPSHYQIAKINYDNDNSEGALTILDKVLKMSPDSKTYSLTSDLIKTINCDYVDKAVSFNTKKDFDNSLIWLKKSTELSNKYTDISFSTMSVITENAYKVAYNGKYEIFLASVDLSFKSGNLSSAESNLDIAAKYQTTYSSYINSNTEIITRHTNIYDKYLSNADASYISKSYDKALTDYLNAQRICKAVSYIPCNENLTTNIFNSRTGIYTTKIDNANASFKANNLDLAESTIDEANTYQTNFSLVKDSRVDKLIIDIKQVRYDKNITEGTTKVTTQDFKNALINFNAALEIENNYGITPNKKLISLITSTAKSLTLQKIEEGEKKVNINDLASARTIFQEANELKNSYLLSSDKDVLTAISALNDKIFQQECLNYRSNYDGYYQQAINSIFDSDYITADSNLKLAIEVTTSHTECMIDGTNAIYKKKEIEEAFTYQTKIAEAKKEVTNKNYKNSVIKYLEAQEYFATKDIGGNFSLTHVELYNFISQNTTQFIDYGVKYYSENSDLDNALNLMKLLESKGYDYKLTKTNQTFLGTQLAIRDHTLNASVDAKTKITEYTADNKWYKYLAKAYKKQLKSL